jgi:hypothetical protein
MSDIDHAKRHEAADGHLPTSRELLGCLVAWLLLIFSPDPLPAN